MITGRKNTPRAMTEIDRRYGIMMERLPPRDAALAQPVQDATDDPPIQETTGFVTWRCAEIWQTEWIPSTRRIFDMCPQPVEAIQLSAGRRLTTDNALEYNHL